MNPWSFEMDGSKPDILAAVLAHKELPDCAKNAAAALFEPHSDLPGYTDEEPGETWARDVEAHPELHSAKEKRPPDRDTYLKAAWRLTLAGHPDAHGTSECRIEAIWRKVK